MPKKQFSQHYPRWGGNSCPTFLQQIKNPAGKTPAERLLPEYRKP